MSKNDPRNASELVGEHDGQDVVVQPLRGRLEPRLEPMPMPALWLDQDDPRGLHEQNTQIAIAAFRYLAKDGAIAGRDLLWDKTQPSSEVAAFGKRINCADCRHDRAGDERSDPGNAHQSLTAAITAGKNHELARPTLDPLIEPAPVSGHALDDAQHAR